MPRTLHLDLETYSSVDLRKSGAYKYCQSLDFEILMCAYCLDDGPIGIVDFAQGETWPEDLLRAINDPSIDKCAHNAAFERTALNAVGIETPIKVWKCTAIKAAFCGLPLGLDHLSKVLGLTDKAKLTTGKQLIRYFCVPVKPTKSNDQRVRNFPRHDLQKWNEFKTYCIGDVEAEREVERILSPYYVPSYELAMYELDQKINDRGILADTTLAKSVIKIDKINSGILRERMQELTGLENPNSPAQLTKWLSDAMQRPITTIAKDALKELKDEAGPGLISEVLDLRGRLSKTSIKKYDAILNCANEDHRIRGLFQFYGANRTGRWAGRLVQLQNLKRNKMKDLDTARTLFRLGDFDTVSMSYDNLQDIMSQLIRTALIAPEGKVLAVSDFSAIEARVLAWLADETWRLDVFNTHGKIYEASAAKMFSVPMESITKDSDYRAKGKIAELALGYQGALGALHQMGGASMGLTDDEMLTIVKAWRSKSPNIKNFWKYAQKAAINAVKTGQRTVLGKFKNIAFDYDGKVMTIELPNGRKLYYQEPTIYAGEYGPSLKYKGLNQETRKWQYIKTYGGKLVENITQAVARDLLCYNMLKLDSYGYYLVMHVHDEVAAEVDESTATEDLNNIEQMMSQPVPWAEGLPLGADGYLTKYYKKD